MSNCTGVGCTHPSHGSHNVLPFNPFVNPPKPEPQPTPIRIWRCRRFVPFWLFNLVMRRCNRTPTGHREELSPLPRSLGC
jgi:hypothetical protein